MNALQIIVHLPLFAMSYPTNAFVLSGAFMDMAEFDIIPHGMVNPHIFKFGRPVTPKEKFVEVGYDSSNFILNAGSVFWFIVLWVFMAFVA